MKDVKEPEYIFPEDIKPLVAKAPEKRTVTMRLFTENGDNNGEDGKSDDGQDSSAQESI